MRLVNKIIAVASVLVVTLSLTGCDDNAVTFATEAKTALVDRMTLNMKCLEKIKESGLISELQYAGMQKNLQEVSDRLSKIKIEENNGALNEIGKACAWYQEIADPTKEERDEDDVTTKKFLTRHDHLSGVWSKAAANGAYDVSGGPLNSDPYVNKTYTITSTENDKLENRLKKLMGMKSADAGLGDGQVKPIEILSSAHMKEFNDMLNYEVWVLKDDLGAEMQTLDAVKMAVKEATGQQTGATNAGKVNVPLLLQAYFKNSEKTFIDYTDTTENLPIQFSKIGGSNNNKPGIDLVLKQTVMEEGKKSRTSEIMTIRFLEFDSEVIDKLTGTAGGVGQKYIVVPGTSGQTGRIYLLEYPVSVIDKVTLNENTGSIATTFKETKLKVNLLNDTLINNLTLTEQGEPPYINTGTVSNPYKDGNSAFGIYGSIETQVVFSEHSDNKADVGRIVLRDYLEYSLMPGVHSSENVVALGRKVRVLHFDGKATDQYACYVDNLGNNISNSSKIYVRDLMDLKRASDEPTRAKLNVNNVTTDTSGSSSDDEDTGDDMGTGVDTIPLEYVSGTAGVKPVGQFAGNHVNTGDASTTLNTTKMLYWGMALDVNPFDSKLYSDWMEKKSDTAGLNWWLGYVKAQGYTYTFETGDIQEFFKGNYNFSSTDDGFIKIDLDVVAKIQDDYTAQKDVAAVTWISTTFVIIGFLLLGWSLVLMGCWAIDTNMDGGFNTLTKASMGRWVAVKYDDEMPNSGNDDSEVYLTFGKMFMRVIVVIAIAVLLVSVDIVRLIVMMVEAFGGIAEIISKNIFNG